MAAKQSMKASVANHSGAALLPQCRAAAIPLVRINRPLAVTQNKKAAGQASAHVRNGLIGSFAW